MSVIVNQQSVLSRVVGDREAIGATLKENDGTVIDVTGDTILFRMVNRDTGEVTVDDAAATVDDGSAGQVSYTPAAADVDEAGEYAAYFIIDDTIDRRFPYDGAKLIVRILPETDTLDGY